jgi:hypothetical protein
MMYRSPAWEIEVGFPIEQKNVATERQRVANLLQIARDEVRVLENLLEAIQLSCTHPITDHRGDSDHGGYCTACNKPDE